MPAAAPRATPGLGCGRVAVVCEKGAPRGRVAVVCEKVPRVPSSLVLRGQIREAVRGRLTATHGGPPDTLVRLELGLSLGATHVDTALLDAMQGEAAGLPSAAAR